MIARSFVAERLLDEHEVRRRAPQVELSGRGHADKKAAARHEELLGDQNRKGCGHCGADQSELDIGALGTVELPCGSMPRRDLTRAAEAPPWRDFADDTVSQAQDFRAAAFGIMSALREVGFHSTSEQRSRALEVLNETKRKLYAILAESE